MPLFALQRGAPAMVCAEPSGRNLAAQQADLALVELDTNWG
jgi:hypothetical protein